MSKHAIPALLAAADRNGGQMKPKTYGSLFSGTECMSAAAIGLPLVPKFFAEVEPYPCAILRSKFPNVPNLGDVTGIKYNPQTKEISNARTTVSLPDGLDILCGGSPCQDFSVAGKRAGADGDDLSDGGTTRSSLIFTYIRLLREIRPRYCIYENVPGMLTSNEGRDFAHFLVALGECGYAANQPRWILFNLLALDNPDWQEEWFAPRVRAPQGENARSMGEHEGVFPSLKTDCGSNQSVAYGINAQASLMHPCTREVSQTLTVCHQGGGSTGNWKGTKT